MKTKQALNYLEDIISIHLKEFTEATGLTVAAVALVPLDGFDLSIDAEGEAAITRTQPGRVSYLVRAQVAGSIESEVSQ